MAIGRIVAMAKEVARARLRIFMIVRSLFFEARRVPMIEVAGEFGTETGPDQPD